MPQTVNRSVVQFMYGTPSTHGGWLCAVQIPHMSEGMVGRWTPSYPAIVRTFVVRIINTIGLMFHPGLLDFITFVTEGTDVTPSGLGRCLNTMLGLLVLAHYLVE